MDDRTKTAFGLTFATEHGKIVLEYLEKTFRADEAEFCNDVRKSDYIQGQRSVVLEIRKIIKE